MSKHKKVILTVLDGWGIGPESKYNAIDNAKTPNFDKLVKEYPNTRLKSDGLAVGLPEGQFGTSEVNHLTIGAGRVIFQDLPKINNLIETGEFFSNKVLNESIEHALQNKAKIHLIGIISDGGVHSNIEHLFAIFELLNRKKFTGKTYLHLFTDGRDVAPKSAEKYFKLLDKELKKYSEQQISIASIQGRFYLDRDRDWARTDKAFDLMRSGKGKEFTDWESVINYEYNHGRSDEFIEQYLINKDGLLSENDSVIFFHYRTDRLYQIVSRTLQEKLKNTHITTFINVSEEFTDLHIAIPREEVKNTLAEVISSEGKSQLHVTETEKYTHLTFFLNGEREKEFPFEKWKLFESNRFVKPFYNFDPSMRNFEIAQEIIESIEGDKYDFIIANFSSPDMVGHTGNYEAAVVSTESVDYCLGKIYETIKDKLDDYAWIITADHGNSDIMWDEENNQPHTQHTTSPVPFILVSDIECTLDKKESLSDVAPTVLDLMGLKKAVEMTGNSLIIRK